MRLNVATKTTLTTLLVVAASLAVAGWILLQGIAKAARQESVVQSKLLARTLAGSFAVPLARGQHEVIQRQIDQMAELPERFPDVVRVAVVDQSGRIVAHTDPVRFGDLYGAALPEREEVQVDLTVDPPITVVRTPVETAVRFGTLEVALAVAGPFQAAKIASRQVVAALLATMLVLVAVLSWSLHRLVVRPLRRMATAVRAYDADQRSLGVPVDGPAEILTLVGAFNGMAERLHENTTQLERKVEERTRELRGAYDRLTVANQQLQELAITDGLTGLANRRAFTDRLAVEVERARRTSLPLSLVLFDLDHFKRLNDTLGHLEGDAALVLLAGLLREGRRGGDLVARYGGEEFAMLLPETVHGDALLVAERLRRATEEAVLPASCTVSAGVATLPDQAEDARSLIAAADHALYAAKNAGRNRVRSARDEETTPAPPPGRASAGGA